MRFQDLSSLEASARESVRGLVGLGRYQKRTVLAICDVAVLSFALWFAMSARLGELYVPPSWEMVFVLGTAPVIGVATFFRLGLYRLVTRYIGGRGAMLIAVAVGLSGLFWALVVLLSGVGPGGVPRSVTILYPIFGAAMVWGTRQAAGWVLRDAGFQLAKWPGDKTKSVVIYGAGTTGIHLLEALRNSPIYQPVAFVDPNPTIWRQYVGGLKVHSPERLAALIERNDVREVLLAMPKAQRRERRLALAQLERLAVAVRTLPAIEDLADGRVTVSDLRPVEAEDLLGRDPVPPNTALLGRNITGKSVMVTGAGGSIGSELVRQILRQQPARLVLLDAAEGQLYQIESEVEELLQAARNARAPGTTAASPPRIAVVLGSVLDGALLKRTIEMHAVHTIYHAAAFKHVPIVEHNVVAGLRNNTLGTAVLAEAAERCGVERVVLISTDKAVRPTSIMGASKRLAEMVLQARAATGSGATVFTMVRFGNVLDSSGSVVRLFRRQIEAGGPVTVTHRDVIRYFMSIPEAAGLVIQAGAMATGGDVFVLEMGEPVKIDTLARSMIRLMGLEVRDAQHPDGEIAIEYVGLRPGEKLHEELLLGDNTTRTEHPRILKCLEPCMPAAALDLVLDRLKAAIDGGDAAGIRALLMQAVEGYHSETRHLTPKADDKAPAHAPASAPEPSRDAAVLVNGSSFPRLHRREA
jgi:FlaA1/EpsC-like NDP-sugar epimerase